MTKPVHSNYFVLLFCFFPLSFYGQNKGALTIDSVKNAFVEQIEVFPQEKIFLHTDRTAYVAGDTIWLKTYLVDAVTLIPSVHSHFAYVDLIDSEGNSVERVKIRIAGNASCGQISVSPDLPEGNYSLRAYTTAMYGLSHDFFFKKDIFIASRVKPEKRTNYRFETPPPAHGDADLQPISAEWKNDMLRVTRNSRDTSSPQYLLIHTRGIAHYFEKWPDGTKTLLLAKQNFPSGMVQVALLDENYKSLCQKMLFCENDDHAHIDCSFEKNDSALKVKFLLTDSNRNKIKGNFSVSVTNDNQTATDTTLNIRDYLLFDSDLKERNQTLSADFVADETWKRYDIPQIIRGKMDTLPGFIELGQAVSGRVKRLLGKRSVPEAQVNIMSLQTRYASLATTDSSGVFSFDGMNFPDKTEFVVQAYNARGSSNVELIIDEDDFPSVEAVDLPAQIDSVFIVQTQQYNQLYGNMRTIQLPDVIVSTRKIDRPPDPYPTIADISFDSKRISEMGITHVSELLQRVAGVQVSGNNVIIRGSSSIHGNSLAAIAIDGVIVETANEDRTLSAGSGIDAIDLSDIERVDIFKGGSSMIWGSRGGSGVISFTTKRGNFEYSKIEEIRYNTKKITPLGYVRPAKFSRHDFSPLIYWDPNVTTDETGETSIEFPVPATEGVYSIIVQGITNEGLVIHKTGKIRF